MRPERAVIEGEREGRIIEVLMRCQVRIGCLFLSGDLGWVCCRTVFWTWFNLLSDIPRGIDLDRLPPLGGQDMVNNVHLAL